MQHSLSLHSSSFNNNNIDSSNTCIIALDQSTRTTPLVSTHAPPLLDTNRTSPDNISVGSHSHSQHQSRAVAATIFGAKCVSLSKANGQNKIKIPQAMRTLYNACDSCQFFFI